MKKLLFVVMMLLLACSSYADSGKVDTAFYKKYTAAGYGGDSIVYFDHAAHVNREGKNCDTCHGVSAYLGLNGYYVKPANAHAICRQCHIDEKEADCLDVGGVWTGNPSYSCSIPQNIAPPISCATTHCHGIPKP